MVWTETAALSRALRGQAVVGRGNGHHHLVIEEPESSPALALKHADDCELAPVDPYRLAHRVPKSEQALRHPRPEDSHLGAVQHVSRRYELARSDWKVTDELVLRCSHLLPG